MLHIVLLILKIIGITLGILAGILLLSLCLALFVPVRYQVEAKRTEGEENPPVEAKVKITWLLHFINVRILYPSEVYLRARILFITVFKLPKKQKKTKKKTKRDKKDKKAGNEENGQNAENRKPEQDGAAESGQDAGKETSLNIESETEKAKQTEPPKSGGGSRPAGKESGGAEHTVKADAAESAAGADTAENKEKLSLKERIIKICKFFQNIRYTITGICDKIKAVWKNMEYYLNILQSDTFKQAFSLCKGELVSILSYIRPRKFNADFTVGMGDPASTGQILSFYGILYPLIGNHVIVTGDFENKRIEGAVFIKGKMKLFTFLKTAVRIYFNKDIRKLIQLFKKEDV